MWDPVQFPYSQTLEPAWLRASLLTARKPSFTFSIHQGHPDNICCLPLTLVWSPVLWLLLQSKFFTGWWLGVGGEVGCVYVCTAQGSSWESVFCFSATQLLVGLRKPHAVTVAEPRSTMSKESAGQAGLPLRTLGGPRLFFCRICLKADPPLHNIL